MKKIFLSFITGLLGISLMAQNTADLKLNLVKNKVYKFKSTSEQTISQTVNGVQQTTNSKTNYAISLKMVDATPDFLITEVHVDTIITNTNAMGKIVSINSSDVGNIKSTDMADVMSCIMNRLSKNALYVKMDQVGKVIEIVNIKMLFDVIMKDTSSITGETASVTKMQIKNTINDKALKSMIEMFTYNLPGQQVAPGDKWDIAVTVNSGGMLLDIITTYNLNEIRGSAANIAAESNIKASDNAGPIEYGPAKVSYGDLKGMGKSKMVLDTRTGLLTENISKTHIAGNLTVSAQGMNIQIPMEINGESKVIALQ